MIPTYFTSQMAVVTGNSPWRWCIHPVTVANAAIASCCSPPQNGTNAGRRGMAMANSFKGSGRKSLQKSNASVERDPAALHRHSLPQPPSALFHTTQGSQHFSSSMHDTDYIVIVSDRMVMALLRVSCTLCGMWAWLWVLSTTKEVSCTGKLLG